jgi:hypothetical protein
VAGGGAFALGMRARAARIAGLVRGRVWRAAEARPPALGPETTITLRLSDRNDEPAIERLGGLSERQLPSGRYLVAEVDGRVWAALPLSGGEPLADPFLPALEVKELLSLRVAQLDAHAGSLDGGEGRLFRLDDRFVVPRSVVESR